MQSTHVFLSGHLSFNERKFKTGMEIQHSSGIYAPLHFLPHELQKAVMCEFRKCCIVNILSQYVKLETLNMQKELKDILSGSRL